ncbi:MAG: HDOD domain-containing protein [Desulfovibrionaceae bacterium]
MAADLRAERKDVILAVRDLPTLPQVLGEVNALVENPETPIEKIAKVIAMDQALSAKVLRMVNSPVYGLPGKISSVHHALVMLGINVIRGIIISTSVFDAMQQTMRGMWEHSLGCAMASAAIARAAGFKDADEYSVPGLLHDLGKVVAALQLPQLKKEVDRLVAAEDIAYLEAEKRVYGFGHDRVNAWLATHWRLPVKIKEGMAYHHAPTHAEHYPAVPCVVHVADFVVRVFEFGNSGDDALPVLDQQAMKLLKLDLPHLEGVMNHLAETFLEVSDLSLA